MDIKEMFGTNFIFLDGAMGTLLQQRGLRPGELPETWNIERPDDIASVHLSYFNAGSNIVCANTFGANLFKFPDGGKYTLEAVVAAAAECADRARRMCQNAEKHLVALDIGPCGKLLKPLGDLDFEDAVSLFARTVKAAKGLPFDLILIETMNDLYETKAAVLAAKENSDLPIFVTNAYDTTGNLMTGASPEAVVATLEGLGVSALGMNCSFGPEMSLPTVERLCRAASVPVVVKPNAGLPVMNGDDVTYDVTPREFAATMRKIANLGARFVGGCCGTTPEYIKSLTESLSDMTPKPVTEKNISCAASYTHAVNFGNGEKTVLIGERLNPTGKKRLKEALKSGDSEYILGMALSQVDCGAQILDINVGLPEIDEVSLMPKIVAEVQSVTDAPLQIDTSNPAAMERAMRIYNGKPMINSVNGTRESMEAVFPLVKKYGGLVVALTLDENGIPKTADERVKIAERIFAEAEKYGIKRKNIVVDTLAMTVSADTSSALCTLGALEKISAMGVNTVLGVSNISFGLPEREVLTSTFFAMAMTNGLSSAIMNPQSVEMMKAYRSFAALSNLDENCSEYIAFTQSDAYVGSKSAPDSQGTTVGEKKPSDSGDNAGALADAIVRGLKDSAYRLAKEALETRKPLDVINGDIVPALDKVGRGFENKTVYLPQLLMSAETAKKAFDAVKETMIRADGSQTKGETFVIATVKGDIHDIGKNIVKVLLENYGFNVVDLGRDVPPQTVADAVIKHSAPFLGLSALMTTTVGAMAETVKLVKEVSPETKIVVGGAVLTEEYAMSIGADKYAADAMETVRYALSAKG